MQLSEVIILGLVQGLTEFLPVSSKAHLFLARYFWNISDDGGVAFDAFLHLGTLAAVLVYYWRVWWAMGKSVVHPTLETVGTRALAANLILATIPAAIVGYSGWERLSELLRSPTLVMAGLIGTGIVLLGDIWRPGSGRRGQEDRTTVTFVDALFIGLAQVLALLPGVSRSGITIAAGRLRGLSRQQAILFSFLLSAPIIAGAGAASLVLLLTSNVFPLGLLGAGFGISFVSGLLAIHLLLRVVERFSLLPFTIYLFAVAVVLWYVR